MMFSDRVDAGRRLAGALKPLALGRDCVVAGIPRGGMVIGMEIASALGCRLDYVVSRKIGAAGNAELAIGAVAEDGSSYVDAELAAALGMDRRAVDGATAYSRAEALRRAERYSAAKSREDLNGVDVILADDGIATGYTMLAASRFVKKAGPRSIIAAAPIAAADSAQRVMKEVDQLVCLDTLAVFSAIGEFYIDFGQVSDEEVMSILERSSRLDSGRTDRVLSDGRR